MSIAPENGPVPSCPNCRAELERGGDQEHRYWSCRTCNLIFLS